MVQILDQTGKKLVPTQRHGRVRWLLNTGKAHIVQYNPFTIQLAYEVESRNQKSRAGRHVSAQN